MINKQKIKQLAIIASENKTIPHDIEQFVLNNMGKQELKMFLRHYKISLDKKRIYVTSADTLSSEYLSMLNATYKGKDIITRIDENLGAGLKIIENDMIVDFTFKKYINDTIDILKN